MATIQQIIGKVNPKAYAKDGAQLLKKYGSAEKIPAEEIEPKPLAEHTLVYDSSSETLEPVYFFILDLMNDFGLTPQKYVDTFSSTPGSGHFAELGQRGTIMQQQGAKILGDINTVLRSVLNIVYDLKEFRIRLQNYEDLKSDQKESALLSLKQIWMDKVDIVKGNSSIKAMAMGQAGFQTLIDAFLVAKDEKDVNKIDLNDRVRRILLPRIREFNIWVEQSEKELRKRYELERIYLGSQVNSLKLYSRWAKPYLKAAQQLEMKEMKREPALVKTFNTILLQLTLLGKIKIKIEDAVVEGKLSAELKKIKTKRDYFSCILVDFKFRGIPQKVSQQPHYLFGGKAEITFKAYALNNEELKKIEEELEQSDVEDVLKLIEGTTTESLKQLQDEINFFLEDKTKDVKEKKSKDSSNPFLALIGRYESKGSVTKEDSKKLTEKPKKIGPIKPDNFIESEYIRPLAIENATDINFNLFDVYKKAHGMPSYT
jgi:hypothetical protein